MVPSPNCDSTVYGKGEQFRDSFLIGLHKAPTSYFLLVFWQLACMLATAWHRSLLMRVGLWEQPSDRRIEALNTSRLALLMKYEKALLRAKDLEAIEKETQRQEEAEEALLGDMVYRPNTNANTSPPSPSTRNIFGSAEKIEAVGPAGAPPGMTYEPWEPLLKSEPLLKAEPLLTLPVPPEPRQEAMIEDLSYLNVERKNWRSEIEFPDPPSAEDLKVNTLTRRLMDYLPWEVICYFLSIIPYPDSRIHSLKPGRDFYGYMAGLEIVSAIYILLLYSSMASATVIDVTASLQVNMFSGSMVLTFLGQLISIVVDRAIYLRRSLIGRLVWQYILILLWTYIIFWEWPTRARRAFQKNPYLEAFFLLKAAYFTFGAMQLRYGYVEVECEGFGITGEPSTTRGAIFRSFRAIPFLFELKTIMDYIFTDSALDLWEMFKFEDIYAVLYGTQCDIEYRKRRGRGETQTMLERILYGWIIFMCLFAVLFSPILIFSTANPGTQSNNVQRVQLRVQLLGSAGTFELLTVSSVTSLVEVSKETYQNMVSSRMVDENDDPSNCQSVTMASSADAYWSITPPSFETLVNILTNDSMTMHAEFIFSFTRPGPTNNEIVSIPTKVELNQTTQLKLASVINGSSTEPVGIPMAIPKYFRLYAVVAPVILAQSSTSQTAWLDMVLSSPPSNGQNLAAIPRWWTLRAATPSHTLDGINFVTASNPITLNFFGGPLVILSPVCTSR
eukprot:g23046.t1